MQKDGERKSGEEGDAGQAQSREDARTTGGWVGGKAPAHGIGGVTAMAKRRTLSLTIA